MVWRVTTSLLLALAEDPIRRGVEPRPAHGKEEQGDGKQAQIGPSEQSSDPKIDAEPYEQGTDTDQSEPHAHEDESHVPGSAQPRPELDQESGSDQGGAWDQCPSVHPLFLRQPQAMLTD
jgi:hypothetical protein